MAEKSSKTPVEENLEKLHIHEHTEHCKHGPHERPHQDADDDDENEEDDEALMNSEAFRQFLLRQQMQQQHGQHQHSECCSHNHHGDHDDHHHHYHNYKPENKFSDKAKFFVPDEQEINGIFYTSYKDESQLKMIMDLISKDLSEPYSIYTYRYFIYNWPNLCFLVRKIFQK
jgi:hypothetical protein